MPNMNYCRFHNTLRDLEDCANHMNDDLSKEEREERGDCNGANGRRETL